MLADSVEAAVRAMLGPMGRAAEGQQDQGAEQRPEDPSARGTRLLPAEIQTTVRGVLDAKMREGQLAEVDITLRDLALVESAFVETLQFMHHSRQTKAVPGTGITAKGR